MKELTLEKNLMDISNVEKCSPSPLPLKDIKELILERKGYEQFPVTLTNVNSLFRDSMNVRNERQPTLYPISFILIKKHTGQAKLM
jgi:hypothetical protein